MNGRRSIGEWLAIAGTVLTAAVILFVALGVAALARGILGDASAPLGSQLIPALIAAAACAILVIGLMRRSRAAYLVAVLVSGITLYVWADLMLGASTSPLEPIPLLTVLPPAMVVIGLAVSWREFWGRDEGT